VPAGGQLTDDGHPAVNCPNTGLVVVALVVTVMVSVGIVIVFDALTARTLPVPREILLAIMMRPNP